MAENAKPASRIDPKNYRFQNGMSIDDIARLGNLTRDAAVEKIAVGNDAVLRFHYYSDAERKVIDGIRNSTLAPDAKACMVDNVERYIAASHWNPKSRTFLDEPARMVLNWPYEIPSELDKIYMDSYNARRFTAAVDFSLGLQEDVPSLEVDDYTVSKRQAKESAEARDKIISEVLSGEKSGMYTAFKKFSEHGVWDIRNEKVELSNGTITGTGWKQLRAAMEIYRNKRFETMRYVFIDRGTGVVKDQIALSSHLPNVSVVSEDNGKTLMQVITRAKETNCVVAMAHNHPSGNVEQSIDDMKTTEEIEKLFRSNGGEELFAGHIILDHENFNLYTPGKGWSREEIEKPRKDGLEKENKSGWENKYIGSTEALKNVALGDVARAINESQNYSDDFVPVAFADTQLKMSGVQFFHKSFFEKSPEFIKEELELAGRQAGATRAFPVFTEHYLRKLDSIQKIELDKKLRSCISRSAFCDACVGKEVVSEKYGIEPGNAYFSAAAAEKIVPEVHATFDTEKHKIDKSLFQKMTEADLPLRKVAEKAEEFKRLEDESYWKDKFINENAGAFKALDDYLNNGTKPKNDEFIFKQVPEILKAANVSENEIVIKTSVINKARNEHHLSEQEIKDSVKSIASPVLIFDSDKNTTENKKNSFLSITDTFAENGKPVAFSLNLDSEYEKNRSILNVNQITSIHDRTLVAKNGTDLIQKWTESSLCRYVDDKKISEWQLAAGVYFPLAVLHSDKNRIKTFSDFVKEQKASRAIVSKNVELGIAEGETDFILNQNVKNPWFEKLSELEKEAVLSDMRINPDLIGEYQQELDEKNIEYKEYDKPPKEWLLDKINYKDYKGEFSYFNENNAGQQRHYSEVFAEYEKETKIVSENLTKSEISQKQEVSLFDKELYLFNNGQLDEKHVFNLGKPGEILKNCGFPENDRIELVASRLKIKASQGNHPFEIMDILGLDKALQNPIAVFEYGEKEKAQNVIVNLEKDGKNFLVGVFFNQKKDGFEVSSIRGLFNRDNLDWMRWIQQGKMIYGDKEKIQVLANQQRTNLADVNSKEARTSSDLYYLDSLDNILQNFGDVKNIYRRDFPRYTEQKEKFEIFKQFRSAYQEKDSINIYDAVKDADEFYKAIKNNDKSIVEKFTNGIEKAELASAASLILENGGSHVQLKGINTQALNSNYSKDTLLSINEAAAFAENFEPETIGAADIADQSEPVFEETSVDLSEVAEAQEKSEAVETENKFLNSRISQKIHNSETQKFVSAQNTLREKEDIENNKYLESLKEEIEQLKKENLKLLVKVGKLEKQNAKLMNEKTEEPEETKQTEETEKNQNEKMNEKNEKPEPEENQNEKKSAAFAPNSVAELSDKLRTLQKENDKLKKDNSSLKKENGQIKKANKWYKDAMYKSAEIKVNGIVRECKDGLVQGFKNAVSTLDKVRKDNIHLAVENKTLKTMGSGSRQAETFLER